MAVVEIKADGIEAHVSTRGGRILRLDWRNPNAGGLRVPLLRNGVDGSGPNDRSAFALVPFGNRLPGNAFAFEGREHRLPPNTRDPAYLHGDGWLGDWTIASSGPNAVRLAFRHEAGPYRYEAYQDVRIEAGAVHLALAVVNRGEAPMPFGLGWHPFVPRTPRTLFQAQARGFRTEWPGHLPGPEAPLPDDLVFTRPAPLPERWVNNGLEGWNGRARVFWPECGAGLDIAADPVFAHAFLFLPDRDLSPDADWFCFEPMTHGAGGHHRPDLGGLARLAPGETLSGTMRLAAFSSLTKIDRP